MASAVERYVAAGVFRQNCLRLLDEVNKMGVEIVITKPGRPTARLVPAGALKILGTMAGTAEITGDLYSTGEIWEADDDLSDPGPSPDR